MDRDFQQSHCVANKRVHILVILSRMEILRSRLQYLGLVSSYTPPHQFRVTLTKVPASQMPYGC